MTDEENKAENTFSKKIGKGIEYDCKKTSYEDLSFTWEDYSIILVGLVFLGITIWQKV